MIDRVSPPTTTTKGSDVGVGSNSTEFQSTRVGVGVGGCIFINIIIGVRMPTLFRARHERDGRRRATGVDARGGRKGCPRRWNDGVDVANATNGTDADDVRVEVRGG